MLQTILDFFAHTLVALGVGLVLSLTGLLAHDSWVLSSAKLGTATMSKLKAGISVGFISVVALCALGVFTYKEYQKSQTQRREILLNLQGINASLDERIEEIRFERVSFKHMLKLEDEAVQRCRAVPKEKLDGEGVEACNYAAAIERLQRQLDTLPR